MLSLATTLFIAGRHNKPFSLLWLIEAGSSSVELKISEVAKTHLSTVRRDASEQRREAKLDCGYGGSAVKFEIRIRS